MASAVSEVPAQQPPTANPTPASASKVPDSSWGGLEMWLGVVILLLLIVCVVLADKLQKATTSPDCAAVTKSFSEKLQKVTENPDCTRCAQLPTPALQCTEKLCPPNDCSKCKTECICPPQKCEVPPMSPEEIAAAKESEICKYIWDYDCSLCKKQSCSKQENSMRVECDKVKTATPKDAANAQKKCDKSTKTFNDCKERLKTCDVDCGTSKKALHYLCPWIIDPNGKMCKLVQVPAPVPLSVRDFVCDKAQQLTVRQLLDAGPNTSKRLTSVANFVSRFDKNAPPLS